VHRSLVRRRQRDWYSHSYYSTSPVSEPENTAADFDFARVIRSDYFGHQAPYMRAGYRAYVSPSNTSYSIGLRCSRSYP